MLGRIKQSSLEAYQEIRGIKEPTQCERISNYVKQKRSCTRRQIANALGMETSTVSARVNKLIKDNILYESKEIYLCPISKKRTHWLEHKSNQVQMELI